MRMAAKLTWEEGAFFGLTTLILQQSAEREREKSTVMQQRDEGQRGFLSSPAQPASVRRRLNHRLPPHSPSLPLKSGTSFEEEEKEDEHKSEGEERERDEGGKQQLFLLLHPSTMSPFGRLSAGEWTGPRLPPPRVHPIHAVAKTQRHDKLL